MIQELDPSPASTTSWLISHLNGSSSWSSKRKKRIKGKEGSLIIKDNSLGGIHRKYCLGLGLVKPQIRWTRDGHQNEVALGRDISLLRCTSPPPKVDTKGRSPALMPSSDRVPAVMGGRPVGAGTCCRKERLGTGALPGATTGGPAAPGSPGSGVSAGPSLCLWDVLAVSLPTPHLAVDWGPWWQGTSRRLEGCGPQLKPAEMHRLIFLSYIGTWPVGHRRWDTSMLVAVSPSSDSAI